MSDEELICLWQSNSAGSESDAQVLAQTKESFDRFERDIRKRDRREAIPALVLIPIFAIVAFFVPPILSKIGAGLVIPACVLVVYCLRKVKRNKPADPSQPVSEFLRQYRVYVVKEMKLLDAALYWYVLPFILPLLVFFIGLEWYWFAVMLVPFALVIYYLNKREVSNYFGPLVSRLDDIIRSLER